ncbi:MAG: DUF721 domain-containing protein [Bdellovibrionota bacterium]
MGDPKKGRKSHLMTSADVLQSLLQNRKSPLTEQFIRWKVWNAWPEVVGEEIGKSTLPVGYLKGTLYIWVKSAPRMQEMLFMLEALQGRINQFCGSRWVKAIRLTLDRRTVPQLADASQEMRDFLGPLMKPPSESDENQD